MTLSLVERFGPLLSLGHQTSHFHGGNNRRNLCLTLIANIMDVFTLLESKLWYLCDTNAAEETIYFGNVLRIVLLKMLSLVKLEGHEYPWNLVTYMLTNKLHKYHTIKTPWYDLNGFSKKISRVLQMDSQLGTMQFNLDSETNVASSAGNGGYLRNINSN